MACLQRNFETSSPLVKVRKLAEANQLAVAILFTEASALAEAMLFAKARKRNGANSPE